MLMQPNQNPPSPPPTPPLQPMPQPSPTPEQNPYGFIMDDKPTQKQSPFKLPGGGSKASKIAILVGGLFFLLIIGWMLLSLIGGGSKAQTEKLLDIAQQQTEIIRVAKIADNSKAIRQTSTRNLAVSTAQIVESDNKQIIQVMANNKAQPKAKELNATADKKTDALLESATSNNTFDESFDQIFTTLLVNYQKTVKDAYDSSSSQSEKQALEVSFNNIAILIKE